MKSLRLALFLAGTALSAHAQTPVEYRFSFPDAVHHVMQVDATYPDLPPGPLTVQISRSSPGRYAAFEFATNVFHEQFTGEDGKPLAVTRPDPRSWTIANHGRTVHLEYQIFGDKVDGTFFAIDSTHAHINFPAVLAWAHGLDDRPWRVTFALPAGSPWQIATQLYPTSDPYTFTAPNLQYGMDAPAELSQFAIHTFQVAPLAAGDTAETLRITVHSQASPAELASYYAGVEKLVREEQAIYGELPHYEPGYYTFLADALPWDSGDGMEHRNSTVMTSRTLSLETAAHEFFHCWNVERIRPEGLEPFNFADVNMSPLMFVAEGFTQYYGQLAMLRTGLSSQAEGLGDYAAELTYVLNSPGARYRSAEDMSRLAPLYDGVSDLFPTYGTDDFVSYYSYGAVIALGLDLELRARTDGRVSLDDFMRAMWRAYGKPGGPAPGLVGHPYTLANVEEQLATVAGDPAFAAEFVRRYMAGTDKLDYAPLLLRAGFVLRRAKGPGTLGPVSLGVPAPGRGEAPAAGAALRVQRPTLVGTPAYAAGLDLDDELISVAGMPVHAAEDLAKALSSHQAGDEVPLVFRRRGVEVKTTATLAAPYAFEILPVESTGQPLSAQQKAFRAAWLASRAKP